MLTTFILALAALQPSSVLGRQLQARDTISNDNYPFCDPATNKNCIVGGKYLVPQLDFSIENDVGDVAFKRYLPTHTFTISQWTNHKMPEKCYYWAVTADQWVATDFRVYNVTFSDCSTPFVVCYHKKATKTINQISTEISRLPVKIRQATSMYLVYGDADSDNNNYRGAIATLCDDGIIVGRSSFYFATSLIHETGHAVDCTLASPDAVHPGHGTEYSSGTAWHNAVVMDGYAVSAYGAGSYVEDFADTGRAALLDNIYPGGLAAFANNNPNLTQITNQVTNFKSVVGAYYTTGGTCDKTKKFPYPTDLVTV
ncbi:hypothetical protein B0H66DRAFT_608767 [Apodospora peruviana]|uniref:Uncharacterized protein n=1 Tax=Apodospora peruviana TaxID=516989 RepID=A0AAE0HTC9_9PEZI|nr:hypothetical protein B0H66DRAFT_608767 [Apodospora peruviana]